MQHERRSGQRLRVSLSVELSDSSGARGVCRAHNVAPEGMLLENSGSLLKIGSRVMLKIGWRNHSWTVSATVTHCNSHCMGVMFSRRQPEFYRTVTRPYDRRGNSVAEKEALAPGAS